MTANVLMSKIKQHCDECMDSLYEGECYFNKCVFYDVYKNGFKINNKSKSIKYFAKDSAPYLAAEYMAKKIAWAKPNHPEIQVSAREKSIQRWAKDIDLLLRIDLGLPENTVSDDFKQVLRLSQTDEFWRKNILSGAALRKNYGKLLMRIDDQEMGM